MRSPRWGCGVKLFAWVVVTLGLVSPTAAWATTQDITSQFAITRLGLVLNRTTNTFDQTVTLKNTSSAPVLGPITVAVSGLPSAVTLANKTGQTSDGKPYVSPMASGALLQSGGTLAFVLKFANPQRVTFPSILQILYTVEVSPDAPSLIGVAATGGTNAFLVGRVDGAANLPITLQAFSAQTCVLGSLVGGAVVGEAVATTTDSAGYFGVSVSGVNPGDFVAVKVTLPTATPMSACLVSSRDNDSWPKAFLLEGSALSARDFIDSAGKARWYKFSVTPGQRIQVTLFGLPADYDLAVFKDIGQAFASQFNPATASAADLVKLTAEYAPSVFSPSVFSPSVFSPDAFSPSVFSPSVFSPSVFSPSVFSPSVFSPSVFSPSVFSPSVFSPSVFSPSVFSPSVFSPSVFSATEIAQAFSTAQTRSIIGVSATAGTGDESVVVNSWNRTGSFYVRVTGRGGTFNTSSPFTVSLAKGPTTCTGVTDTALTSRSTVTASALKTVVLTDSSKVPLDATLDGPAGGTLRTRLSALAGRSEIKGVVIDVASDARVGALKQQAANNPACPFAKNLVAEEIKGIVDSYRANPLQYVLIVGNDDAIPFFRSPDQSSLGQESGYVPPVQSNSPSEASLRLDFVLSQDGYGSKTKISLPSNDFPVPGLAVGRLVETTSEIAGLIDAYVAANGVVSPRSSLVTGYDFLEDAANAVRTELQLGTGGVSDALITPNGKSPQDPASWTATQLGEKLLGSRHDVIFLAGHFSANSALAADFTTSLLTTDLAASTVDLTNSIVFSAGCHAGYNLVDGDAIPGVTLPLDWAQAFARKKATLIAGTGYQYGDTDFLEYSERLYNNFAGQLRAGTGAISVGEALVKAKLDYLATTPDIRGIHEKALLEATLFGLPMLGVNMASGRGAVPGTAGAITPAAVASGPASSLGLKTFDLSVASSLTPHTLALKNVRGGPDITATWLSGPDGVVTKPGEPALPLSAVNVTPNEPSLVLRGIGFRGGTYVDSPPIIPFSGAPSTELRGVHVPFLSPVFFPGRMWTPNYFGALAGSGGTELLVTPAQHRAANVLDGTSTQRKYTDLDLRLYYSGNLSQAALSDAPSIASVDAQRDAGAVVFAAQVVGDPAAAIHQVWVTHTSDGAGAWTSLDLSQCVAPLPVVCTTEDSRLWKGRLPSSPLNLKYVVQAASGVGLVSLDDNRGAYYGFGGATPAATSLALVSPPTGAAIGDTVDITAKLTYAGGVQVAGKNVMVALGGTAQFGTTGSDGSVTVKVAIVAAPANYRITASFDGDEVFLASSTSAPFVVSKAASSLTGLPPAGATLTGVLGGKTQALQQEAITFSVAGPGGANTIFAITDYIGRATLPPPSGLPPGTYTVTQAAFGGNATYAASNVTLAQQFTVAKTVQSITFAALPDKTFADVSFLVFASASSGLPVAFSATGTCTVEGSTVQLTGAGSCTITASQTGDPNYTPAISVSRTFTTATNNKANQVIVFGPAPTNVTFGDPPVTVTATSTSPTAPPSIIPITFSSATPPVCTTGGTNGATVTNVAAGQCTVAANQLGDANYNPAPQVTLVFAVAGAGSTTARFSPTGFMAKARADHTATLLLDGRVLVAGGFDNTGAPLNTAELYCPDNAQAPPSFLICPLGQRGAFSPTASNMPVAAAGQTATRLHDGTVLLIGGANANLQWFTPSDQAWNMSAAQGLVDRTYHTATLLASGEVFVAGGVNTLGVTLSSTFILDPTSVPWSIAQGPDLNFARESHTATLLPDDTVLIAGGRRQLAGSPPFAVVGEYEVYDPSAVGPFGNGVMVDESTMSRSRFWHAAEIAGQRVVIAGGSCDTASSMSSSLSGTEFFSFTTGGEAVVGCAAPRGGSDLQQARRAFTMTPLQDGSLLAIGGADGSSLQRNSSEFFVPASSTFQLGPSMTDARSVQQATLLLDGRVLVTGGIGADGTPLGSAEVFSGPAGTGTSNQPPIANAGPDQTVPAGVTVQLTSAGSGDPEGRALSYFWSFTSKPSGSAAHFSNANAANPTFIADAKGTYVAQLIVNDGGSPPLDSAPDRVQITAGNRAPVALADAYTVAQGATLVINAGTGVLANDSDADGDPLTAALVANVAHGSLTLNADGGFTYAPSASYSGPDSFTYRANDGSSNSNTVAVSLTVTPVNRAPVANAGSNQSGNVAQLVQLAGTCTDIDGDTTTGTWSFTAKPAGSSSALSDATLLNPTFTPDLPGSYQLQLICNDGHVDSSPSTVAIAVASPTINLTLASALTGIGQSVSGTITLSTAAPAGGLQVTLASSNAGFATVAPSPVTITVGATTGSFTVTGVALGTATITGSATGYSGGSVNIDVTGNVIAVGNVTTVPGQTKGIPVTLATPAPAVGVTVNLTSSDTGVVTVPPSVFITAGAIAPAANPMATGVAPGTATITARATGYAPGNGTATIIAVPAQLTVTNTNDSGVGSLRDAIALANLAPDPNTIDLQGVTGTIVLTTGQIRIDGPLTIVGPGRDVLAIDGNLNGRIFTVIENNAPACPALSGPSDFVVSISGLTLKNGSRNVVDSAGGAIQTSKSLVLDAVTIRDSQAKSGGGLAFNAQYPGQTLTITNSQFVNNIAKPVVAGNTGGHNGGAIRIGDYCPAARVPAIVTISTSGFSGNRVQPVELAGTGGAIAAFDNSSLTISDTRIVDNHAEPNPPAVTGFTSIGGGITSTTTSVTIQRSEIADNSATFGGGLSISAPGLAQQPPGSTFVFRLINSTVSANTAGSGIVLQNNVSAELDNSTVADNVGAGIYYFKGSAAEASPTLKLVSSVVGRGRNGAPDVSGGVIQIPSFTIDATNSLVQRVCESCSITLSGSGNLVGVDPLLGPLADNGGPTRAHALLPGSPAIDVGSNPLALTTDQRGTGFPRVAGAAADMGAYEGVTSANRPPVANAGVDQNASITQLVQLNGTCTDVDGDSTTDTWNFTLKPTGSNAVLSSTTILNPTFTPDLPGLYQLQLVCNDGQVDSSPSPVVITASSPTIALALASPLTGVGQPVGGTITLSTAAPAGGLQVTLVSSNTGIASVAPSPVTIAAGTTTGSFAVTGVALGNAIITGSATGFSNGSVSIGVPNNVITVGLVTMAPGQTPGVTVTLATGAPAGGLTVNLASSNTGVVTVPASVFIAAGASAPAANPVATGVAPGNATITGTATGYASGNGTATVAAPVQWTLASGGNNRWYQFIFNPSGFTWEQASSAASVSSFLGVPGYLTTVTSQAENDFLYALAKYPAGATGTIFDPANPGGSLGTTSVAGRDASTWLGGSDSATEGTWRWVNGPETGAVFWNGTSTGSAPAGAFAWWDNPSTPGGAGGNEPNNSVSVEDFLQLRYSGGRWNDSSSGVLQTLPGVNPDGTRVRAPAAFIVEYSPATPALTFTVTNLNDSGLGSLRDAVVQANLAPGPNTINFAPGLTGTILLTSGQMQISGPLTIVGPGATNLTIDGNANSRIFGIYGTDTGGQAACATLEAADYLVSISGLRLANARNNVDFPGGAVYTGHSLALDSVIVENSIARNGGGLQVTLHYPGQALTITNAQFLNNIAKPLSTIATTTSDSGGAINISERCSGTRTTPFPVIITNSLFSGNRVQPVALEAYGGAIASFSYADITITDTRIVDNHIDVPNPPVAGKTYYGGGLYIHAKSLQLVRSEIADNSVNDATSSDQTRGGGLGLNNNAPDLQAPASVMDVRIINSTVSGNVVSATAGAMWVFGNVALEIDNSTLSSNTAAANRTGGIIITAGATNPVSGSNTTAPTLKLISSIIANSSATTADIATSTTLIPSFTIDATKSLIESICSTCNISVSGAGNLTAVDPQLGPLAFNGGPTRTHAVLPGGPVIDAGSNPLALTTDQRGAGFPRVAGAAADMGAYEGVTSANRPPVANAGSNQNAIVSQLVQLTGTCTDVDGDSTTAAWSFTSKPVGSNAALSTATILNPTFTPDLPGSYQLQLICNDGHVDSTPSPVVITVSGKTITLALASPLVGVTRTINGAITLSQPAPAGGLVVTVASGNAAVATVAPSSVTIPAGSSTGSFTVTGVALGGPVTLTGSGTGFTSGTTSVTVTNTLISLGALPAIGLGQSVSLPISLTAPAPTGGVTVNFASSDTSIATVTASVFIAAGQTIPVANPQVNGINIGTAQINADAAGFAPDSRTANVQVNVTFTPTTLNVVQTTSQNITVNISAPAPAGGLTIALATANTSVATVASPVTIPGGQLSVAAAITGVGVGTTTVQATGSGVTSGTATINVTPAPAITIGAQVIGKDLQVQPGLSLGAAAPAGGLVVTLTSSDTSKLLLSASGTALGGASITVTVLAGQSFLNTFFIQSLSDTGTATVTASATGFATTVSTMTLAASGFYNSSPGGNFTTTTFSTDTLFRVQSAQLTGPGGSVQRTQALRGGIGVSVSVPVTVVDVTGTNVGSITTSPVAFNGGDAFKDTAFHPLSAGTAQITVGVPAGFSTPIASQRQITATVTAPAISSGNVSVGRDLQTAVFISLGATPPSPVNVTVTIASGTIAKISNSATVLGGTTLTFNNVTTTSAGTFFVNGLALGGTLITVQAPGYSDNTSTVTVQPSGFANTSPGGNFSTTTLSANTLFRVQPARLDPSTLNVSTFQSLRAELTVNVAVTSSDPNVGTITTSPVTFAGGDSFKDTAFDPASTGTAVLTVGVPAGFDTPSNSRQITATVNLPPISISDQTIGKNLQVQPGLSLNVLAPAPDGLVVTLTSSDAAKVLLSNSATAMGSPSITVTIPAGQSFVNTFFIQSLVDAGTATVTATATGFATDTSTMTLVPAGFANTSPGGNFTTTAGAANTLFRVQPARLDPISLNIAAFQALRGGIGPINVPVTSDTPGVGVITASPLSFSGGDPFKDTAFDPVAAGTAVLTVGAPSGFSTPSNLQLITATVN